MDSGLFGLKKGFSLNMIIFFLILIVVGIMSYQYGLYSPLAIAIMAAVLITIFDAGLGLVTNFGNSALPIATFIAWLVVIGFGLKEVTGY